VKEVNPPQVSSQVLEAHNLNRLAHHRPPRDRVPSKVPLQEVPAAVRGHRQVHRAEVRVHKGRGRVVLPNRTSPPLANKERAGKLANNPTRLEDRVVNPRRH